MPTFKKTSQRRTPRRAKRIRSRRGIALFITLFFVGAVGALALSAIYLTENASLLGKSYDREDELKYAAEAALAMGKAELNYNPAALPSTSYVALMSNTPIPTANGSTVPGLTVDLYAGQTGSTSGQFGRFASLVAKAHYPDGTGFARRLELTQQSFAIYAYWSNTEAGVSFGGGDQLFGPVWSNDNINILSSGASFRDDVGTAGTISGTAYGTFSKGYLINQKPISLPSLSSLSTLSALATAGSMNYPAVTTGDQTTMLERVEFVATDLDASGDSTGANEGFYRIYTANTGQTAWLRADWTSITATRAKALHLNCGDWHATTPGGPLKFFPLAVHDTLGTSPKTWFDTVTAAGMTGGVTTANLSTAHTEGTSSAATIMQHSNARCYLGGDPHLVAVERTTGLGYTKPQIDIGGEDTTFTPTDQFGKWMLYSNSPNATVLAKRPADAKYMYPLYRGYNVNTKGVMYFAGTIGVSGVVRGDLTLYTPKTVVLLDDLRYANDPARGVCVDILGIISGANTVVADNTLNSPQNVSSSGTLYESLDDTPDMYIHAVIMALGNSFTVENYGNAPNNVSSCQGSLDSRGCLYLTGGLIQQTRGAVGTSGGYGFVKRYSYDRCAVVNPPPYFPTTGKFQDNRYYELDPVTLNVAQLFQSLSP